MNKENTLKVVAGVFIILNLILLFIPMIGTVPGGLFGMIMGWGIAIIILQKFFQWVFEKRKVEQSAVVGLITALIFYAVVYSFFTFVA